MHLIREESYDRDHMQHGLEFASNVASTARCLSKGMALFRRGERCTELYIVQSGIVRLLRHQADGNATIMHVAHPGEWIAESSLFADRYHCDAVAENDCRVICLKKAEVLRALEEDPHRSILLAQLLAQRLREQRRLQEILRLRRAADRLLAWLQWRSKGRPARLEIVRTWTCVADELGVSREALYRAIASLKRKGLLRIDGRHAELLSSR
jgi:CRP-like cAMP-binding protein